MTCNDCLYLSFDQSFRKFIENSLGRYAYCTRMRIPIFPDNFMCELFDPKIPKISKEEPDQWK